MTDILAEDLDHKHHYFLEKGKEQEILIKLPFLPWNDDNNKYIQHHVFIITGKLDLRGSISPLLGIAGFLLSLRIMKELA